MAPSHPPKLPLSQLCVISLARLAEPIALTSVFAYLPEMIESFGIKENDVPFWAGVTGASFSLAQAMTGIRWGTASDVLGRKPTLLAGLCITMVATLLFGFSRSLAWAILARSLQGAASGTIGITRTAVAEMVPWKELQPRAFSFMPMVWSIGSVVGPSFGGALALPAKKFPDVFGDNPFFTTYPFVLPNLIAFVMFFFGVSLGFLFLKETLESRKNDRDYGLVLGQILLRPFRRSKVQKKSLQDINGDTPQSSPSIDPVKSQQPVRVRDVFTPQATLCLFGYTSVSFHAIAFDQILPVFLHLSSRDSSEGGFFKFSGGFDMNSGEIGLLLAAYAVLALILQFTFFPPLARHYGVLRCFRVTTFCAPIVYLLVPFTVLFPTVFLRRAAVLAVMAIKCVLCAFWFPCSTILLTNSVPYPRLLGTLNGVATSISAMGRALGPASAGALLTFGQKHGYVIIPWWYLAIFALANHVISRYQIDMDGLNPENGKDENITEQDEDDEQQSLLGGRQSPPPDYSATRQTIR